ncbi:MAG: amidohydrolase family protein [Novosphingobium sp.]|nr:amidohydrolase family protein [Novosphingobium sp.]
MLDLKITGGTVVDGTGRPGFVGDVGVRDGRIVAVGDVAEEASETLDATGRIVAPGFIDVHTHYDAQVFWDPALSPSCFHGVTTVLGGFCGFSVAPLTPESAKYLAPMLARVEGMPLETLMEAVPWNWRSFGDYLNGLDGTIGLNAGFFAGHSAIRRIVMGERSVGEEANDEDLAAMKAMLADSLAEGALGFSTTVAETHNDGDGNAVPSRWATQGEMVELAGIVRDYEGTALEIVHGRNIDEGLRDLMVEMSRAGQRAINWNALAVSDHPDAMARAQEQLAATDYARERGAEVIALTIPSSLDFYLNFKTGFILDSNPGVWREIFKLSLDERRQRFADPACRKQMAEDVDTVADDAVMVFAARLAKFTVVSVEAEHNKKYEGRVVSEIAAEEGREVIDVMLDIVLDDDFLTIFAPHLGGKDGESYALRGQLWQDDRTVIGASDAGAHLDMIDTFAFSSVVLEEGVRNHKVISLENAVQLMTDRPARFMGLVDRGRLGPGYHADIVVFDKDTVGRGPTYNRYDVPCDQFRVYQDAVGIDHVFVNGTQIVRDGEHTGAMPGTVLRSGRDTRTVPLDALWEPATRDRLAATPAE